MIDNRYYYFTILAIFLALGLGMLVGGSWINNEDVVNEQRRFASFIEGEFAELKIENQLFKKEIQNLEASISANQHFVAEILPFFSRDLFRGERIGLVLPLELYDKIGLLSTTLETSGAEATFIIDGEVDAEKNFTSLVVLNKCLDLASLKGENVFCWEGNLEDPLEIFRLLWKLKTS